MSTIAENIVDALIVTLGLDTSEYQQGMDEAERSTREFSEKAPREAERGLNQIEQKFGGAFRGIFHSFIAPLTAALGTMGIFSSYTQTADRIGKTAARIGSSAEDLQAFGEAAKRAGGSVEGFMGAFESLNGQLQRMQAMGGKGRIAPILKQLGISATENGQVKDTFQILRELAGAAERLGKQKFAGLARFLGLDQGTIMLLQQGRVALDEVIKRQKELGVYTKQDFEITAKFNDAISDLTQSFKQLAAPILRVITPALTTVANWITKIAQLFREHQGFIVAGLTVLAGILSGTLLKAVTALGAALAPLLAPLTAIAGLGLLFDDFATYVNGGESALRGFWAAFGTPKELKESAQAVTDWATGIWDTVSNLALDIAAEMIVAFHDWANELDVDGFINSVDRIWDATKRALEPLNEALTPIKEAAKSLLAALGEIGSLAASIVQSIAAVFAPEIGGEWSALRTIAEFAAGVVSNIADSLKDVFDWIGRISASIREAVNAGALIERLSSFLSNLKEAFAPLETALKSFAEPFKTLKPLLAEVLGLVEDIGKSVLEWLGKDEPGGAWDLVKSTIESISITIQAMNTFVRELFGWLQKIVAELRKFLGMNNPFQIEAENKVLQGRDKNALIEARAEAKKQGNPALSDADARRAARADTDREIAFWRDYDLFGNDQLAMAQAGWTEKDVKRFTASAESPKSSAQSPAPVRSESSSGWWASLFGGNGKAADTAAATVASKAADKTEISQDMRKTISVKYDTNVTNNNTFNGVERSAEVRDAVAQGSRNGVERGLSFHTAAVDGGMNF